MFKFNRGQTDVLNEFDKFMKFGNDQVFQFAGNPGTGKSAILNEIIRRSGIPPHRVAPMAFMGAAAMVMRTKGLTNAKTIHSWLKRPVDKPVGRMNEYYNRPDTDVYFEDIDLRDIDMIIVDEGGTVPLELKNTILRHGIPVVVAGDLDQLPPVEGDPAFLFSGTVHKLTEIMRQGKGSNIVQLSQLAKAGKPIPIGNFGDIMVIYDDEVTDDMIRQSEMLLCGKNETRDMHNKYIREQICGYNTDIPQYMERLICRRNNWHIESNGISLANGLVGHVTNYPDPSRFDGKTFGIDFRTSIIPCMFNDLSCDYKYFTAPSERRKYMKYDKYNKGEKFEFAYTITTHLAQGSQFRTGMYFEEYMHPSINNKLNYVGITRFSKHCIYVKRRRKFR